MAYLYHTTDSTEKTKERIVTKSKADKILNDHRTDFADNATLVLTGWNETEMTYSVIVESKDERDRIVAESEKGNLQAEYVSNHKSENAFHVCLYFAL